MRLVEMRDGPDGEQRSSLQFHPNLTVVTEAGVDDGHGPLAPYLADLITGSRNGAHLFAEVLGNHIDTIDLPEGFLEADETLLLQAEHLTAALRKVIESRGAELEPARAALMARLAQTAEAAADANVRRDTVRRELDELDAQLASCREQLAALRARLTGESGHDALASIDPRQLRRARSLPLDELRSLLQAAESMLTTAREELGVANAASRHVSAEDAERLAAVRGAIESAERATGRVGRNVRARLEELHSQERELLGKLGFSSQMEYLLHLSAGGFESGAETRRQRAESAVRIAEREYEDWRSLVELAGRLPELADLDPDELENSRSRPTEDQIAEGARQIGAVEGRRRSIERELDKVSLEASEHDVALARLDAKLERVETELAVWPFTTLDTLRAEQVEPVIRECLGNHPWIEQLGPLPILVDDALAVLPPDARRAAMEFLADLSSEAQVVIVSNDPAIVEFARRRGESASVWPPEDLQERIKKQQAAVVRDAEKAARSKKRAERARRKQEAKAERRAAREAANATKRAEADARRAAGRASASANDDLTPTNDDLTPAKPARRTKKAATPKITPKVAAPNVAAPESAGTSRSEAKEQAARERDAVRTRRAAEKARVAEAREAEKARQAEQQQAEDAQRRAAADATKRAAAERDAAKNAQVQAREAEKRATVEAREVQRRASESEKAKAAEAREAAKAGAKQARAEQRARAAADRAAAKAASGAAREAARAQRRADKLAQVEARNEDRRTRETEKARVAEAREAEKARQAEQQQAEDAQRRAAAEAEKARQAEQRQAAAKAREAAKAERAQARESEQATKQAAQRAAAEAKEAARRAEQAAREAAESAQHARDHDVGTDGREVEVATFTPPPSRAPAVTSSHGHGAVLTQLPARPGAAAPPSPAASAPAQVSEQRGHAARARRTVNEAVEREVMVARERARVEKLRRAERAHEVQEEQRARDALQAQREARTATHSVPAESAIKARCHTHPFHSAIGSCVQCGLPFCDECLVPVARNDQALACVHCALVMAGVRSKSRRVKR